MLINGQWVEAASGKTFDTVNPSMGETLASIAEDDAEDINRAVTAARRAFEGPWSKFKPYERQHVILRLADLIEQHFEEFSVLDTLDMGAPIARSWANRHRTLGRIRYYAAMAVAIHGETMTWRARSGRGGRTRG
jgi:aldehyde dehydrogenase (NAD+)